MLAQLTQLGELGERLIAALERIAAAAEQIAANDAAILQQAEFVEWQQRGGKR